MDLQTGVLQTNRVNTGIQFWEFVFIPIFYRYINFVKYIHPNSGL